ncbi:6968_t:CDS:2 [Paraglomus occultum]|uniref:6968_t:CDS:1 n=1 Tax=Paraglomus occultum TaxID=144539 RepID=A0A9N9CLN3_9GLOM|nr:6968_t:CDS:2 [Paraglomus occultum]
MNRQNKKTTSDDLTRRTPIMRVANSAVKQKASCRQCEKQNREFEELAEKVDHMEEVVDEPEVKEELTYDYADWPTAMLTSFMEEVVRRLQSVDK